MHLVHMLQFFLFGTYQQAPEGESQPSTEVDLFISTEKIMVLNTDLKPSLKSGIRDFIIVATTSKFVGLRDGASALLDLKDFHPDCWVRGTTSAAGGDVVIQRGATRAADFPLPVPLNTVVTEADARLPRRHLSCRAVSSAHVAN
ncbi:unnamed protein product [Notodromas monacha]|uniref:Uncharacterized protein n=1 Tax=Notodromas monacha TaxID=399045 RepID=A0A7R9BGJ0_9CRUS|nr:unnamed protein product [Notodromas monacha]CAG0914339.1 unnamed protein product [Notodromas monacha]